MESSWQGIRHIAVTERLAELVEEKPDGIFAKFGQWAPTYAEVHSRATELVCQLHTLGAQPGDRIATPASNRSELLELLVGVAKMGGIQVPLNPYLEGEFLSHQLRDSAAGIATDKTGWRAVRPLLGEVPSIRAVALLDEVEDSSV